MKASTESKVGHIRRTIARRLTESKQTIPHFYIQTRVDMGRVMADREGSDRRASITSYVVAAVASVLAASPEFNVGWRDDEVVPFDGVGVGVAVATEAGLLVVSKPDADSAGLGEIDEWLKQATGRARELRLTPSDLSPKTLVVSNLGTFPIDSFYAIIDPPDPMILAVGSTRDEYVVVDGKPQVQGVATFSISADHRVIDGADAARFLTAIKTELEAAA